MRILKVILFIFIILNGFFSFSQAEGLSEQSCCVLVEKENDKPDIELTALLSRLDSLFKSPVRVISFHSLEKDRGILQSVDIIWIFKNDTLPLAERMNRKVIVRLTEYLEAGGKMILSNQAVTLLYDLGLESIKPTTRMKKSYDEGYGRQLGYHAFRSHPLFEEMHGGAYVLKPLRDTSVMQTGWFGNDKPFNGKVVAVDWDYIFLREDSKLIVEYAVGNGTILAVGGYLLYSMPNRNSLHLKKFTSNIFEYLAGSLQGKEGKYWNYGPASVIDATIYFPGNDGETPAPTSFIPSTGEKLRIMPGKSSGNFWDLAGERMLLMGEDHGGITEIWAHPVMSLRDYRIKWKMKDENVEMESLANMNPEIEIYPECYVRKYNLNGPGLTETIAVSPTEPFAVIQYQHSGDNPIELDISFKLLFRLMWPYSEKVLGNLHFAWNNMVNAWVSMDEASEYVTVVGIGGNRDVISNNLLNIDISHIEGVDPSENAPEMSSQDVSILVSASGPVSFNVYIYSSNIGLDNAFYEYQEATSDPGAIFRDAASHSETLLNNSLSINSPDVDFNDSYGWALLSTDRFLVTTPGLGSSLVAGYATSDKGWDGEHAVSGRPGYAWYFGRDGEWSGFALLHYGDFEKVRLMLELFQYYQDLNGKILHELSTSGIVHYDAADATPLFIVLAGRYLRHSGDAAFIRKSWTNILKAIDFCYSTDTDGDKLIENTNVGHGWVEGGHLFGSHTSLHLASCWAAALDEAAYMAEALGEKNLAERFSKDANEVKAIINKDFWNAQSDYYYHGLKSDGTYMEDISIMPSIPMLFGQSEPAMAEKILPAFASNAFTTDWGCRIVPENDPHFNPRGYHTGSVWPLFTGWAALAEFKHHNYLQGFSHLASNLMIRNFWGLGFIEEVLNGEVFLPAGVCHHQCWSQTMAIQPLIEGMLGYQPDALNRRLQLSPWFPMNWDSITIGNIRMGEERINLAVQNSRGKVQSLVDSEKFLSELEAWGLKPEAFWKNVYTLSKSTSSRLGVQFQPILPAGCKVERIYVNGQPAKDWGVRESAQGWVIPEFGFWLDSIAVVEIIWHGGITALPLLSRPQPGERSKGFRIISTGIDNDTYTITLQAPRASRQEFRIWAAEPQKVTPVEAQITEIQGNIITLTTEFPDLETDYAVKTVVIRW